ncbi:MAG: hypothetical protein J0M08_01350 [Bacteroidetes bacterium]|nr:hypothetical protein [Bacteroidota bacterium]
MKKYNISTLAVLLFVCSSLFAKENKRKNYVSITTYGGYVLMQKLKYEQINTFQKVDASNPKNSSYFNGCGIKADIRLAKQFSLTLDVNRTRVDVEYLFDNLDDKSYMTRDIKKAGVSDAGSYVVQYNDSRYRARIGATYFADSFDDWSGYIHASVGLMYKNERYAAFGNNIQDVYVSSSKTYEKNYVPTGRVAVGYQILMGRFVGINAELGVGGGPLACIGLQVRL